MQMDFGGEKLEGGAASFQPPVVEPIAETPQTVPSSEENLPEDVQTRIQPTDEEAQAAIENCDSESYVQSGLDRVRARLRVLHEKGELADPEDGQDGIDNVLSTPIAGEEDIAVLAERLDREPGVLSELIKSFKSKSVDRYGDAAAEVFENNIDLEDLIGFLLGGEYSKAFISNLKGRSGGEKIKKMDELRENGLDVEKIVAFTDEDPSKEVLLIVTGLVKANVLSEASKERYLEMDPLEVLVDVSFRTLMEKAIQTKLDEFSLGLQECLHVEGKTLSEEALLYIMEIPHKAKVLKKMKEKEKVVTS